MPICNGDYGISFGFEMIQASAYGFMRLVTFPRANLESIIQLKQILTVLQHVNFIADQVHLFMLLMFSDDDGF